MNEIVRINLDNEMDLILAHKRSMKIAELCGLSLSLQTSFATAVSEISRLSITYGRSSYLVLAITFLRGGKKEINAKIYDSVDLLATSPGAFTYANRLLKNIDKCENNGVFEVCLNQKIPQPGLISEARIESFKDYFKYEPPLSPYDEIRKKNLQLIELSEKLAESENKYRQLTDTLPLFVFSINQNNEISLSNKWMADYLGGAMPSFNKTSLTKILHPDDSAEIITNWEIAKKARKKFQAQARVKNNLGYLWHLISIVPQFNEDGVVNDWIGSFVDINSQKLVEETLKDNKALRALHESLETTNKELSRKNKELEQFAYIASHDLQEPLRKIRNFTSLAELKRDNKEELSYYFKKINASAERMSNLIKDVLNYSKLSIPENAFVDIDLNKVLENVVGDFEFLISDKNATIEVAHLPAITGIPIQIEQLFYNLISNSLKFVKGNPVIKIASAAATQGDTVYNKISVSDNGIGIEEQYLEKIFTIFKRLHPQNEYEGTGIGLALCKKIVENHNGHIEIKSNENGTTVDIFLPSV